MAMEKALAIIGDEVGSQFDAPLAKHFLALGKTDRLAHIVGHSEPGLPLFQCGCGAPLAIPGALRDGDHVYCHCCGSESRLSKHGDDRKLEMTGVRGDASVLAPDSDSDLIGAMVDEIAPHVL
jgi:hypothetical protein